MVKSKEDFIDLVEYYSNRLINEMDELYETEVLSRYNDYRETIEKKMAEKGYRLNEQQEARLFEADRQLFIHIDEVLEWWKNDNIFSLRDMYIDEIRKEQWYWWFDEIKDGVYPFELLPEHLKGVCERFYK